MLSARDPMCRSCDSSCPLRHSSWRWPAAPSSDPAPGDGPQGEVRSFEGSWSAAGLKRTLKLGPGHEAAVFDLSGSVVLSGEHRPAVGFRARVIGFSDDRATMLGRSVWTDERGDQVFSDLRGDTKATGNRIFGTIRGGTGRYAGVTGDYSFEWKYMVESGDGAVSGRAIDLKGQFTLGARRPPDRAIHECRRQQPSLAAQAGPAFCARSSASGSRRCRRA